MSLGPTLQQPEETKTEPLLRKNRRLRWILGASIGCIVLAIWAVAGISVTSIRRAALQNATSTTNNLAASFEDELAHTLGTISLTINVIAHHVRDQGPNFDLYAWSRQVPLFQNYGIYAGIVRPDGILAKTTLAPNVPARYLGDHEHIRILLNHRISGLYIGKPLMAPVIKQVEIPIAARIVGKNGRLLGIVSMIVPPSQLTTLGNKVDLGKHGVITLVGLDHIVRARFLASDPSGLQGIGKSVAGGPEPKTFAIDAAGHFIRKSAIDHVERLFSYRRVGDYPLVVYAGVDLAGIYRDANAQAAIIFWIAATMTVLMGGSGFYLNREIRMRTMREVDLYGERAKLKSANQQLQISNERAEAASRAKTLFLANMSHELRTPLNAIIGFSQVIKDQLMGPLGTPTYVEYAGHINTAGEHLLALIGEILDVAKIEAGTITLNEGLVDPRSIIHDAVSTLTGRAKQKDVAICVNYPENLNMLRLRGDEIRLRQVVVNLLSNAVKFTPEHGHVFVSCEYNSEAGFAFVVADDGIGMTPDESRLALETFGQVNTEYSNKNDGIGLGLPLAVRLVELHGGRLEIQSVKGRGTTVRAFIPQSRAAATAISLPSEAV